MVPPEYAMTSLDKRRQPFKRVNVSKEIPAKLTIADMLRRKASSNAIITTATTTTPHTIQTAPFKDLKLNSRIKTMSLNQEKSTEEDTELTTQYLRTRVGRWTSSQVDSAVNSDSDDMLQPLNKIDSEDESMNSDSDEESMMINKRQNRKRPAIREERRNEPSGMTEKIMMLRGVYPTTDIHVLEAALNAHGESVALSEQFINGPAKVKRPTHPSYTTTPKTKAKANAATATATTTNTIQRPRKRLRQKRQHIGSDSDSDSEDTTTPKQVTKNSMTTIRKQTQVTRFYNSATVREIQEVMGCTPKLAERVIALRPFDGASDLKDKLEKTPGLSKRFISTYEQVLDGYSVIDHIIEEIEHLGGDLTHILEVWNSHKNKLPMDHTTALYQDAMKGYMHQQPRKTAQTISFLARLKEMGHPGPHLIVVPASTIANWQRELENFCPDLNVLCYHGKLQVRREVQDLMYEDKNSFYNIVLTSYTIATQSKETRSALRSMRFKSLILDEGHMIKNCNSTRYTALMSYRIPFRLLITGTPLQNNLQELVSLLMFIMPKMFAEYEEDVRNIFKVKCMTPIENEEDQKAEETRSDQNSIQILSHQRIARAKKMMTPFVLRRKKGDVLKDLPSKIRITETCAMTEKQVYVYDTILKQTTTAYEKAIQAKEEAKLNKDEIIDKKQQDLIIKAPSDTEDQAELKIKPMSEAAKKKAAMEAKLIDILGPDNDFDGIALTSDKESDYSDDSSSTNTSRRHHLSRQKVSDSDRKLTRSMINHSKSTKPIDKVSIKAEVIETEETIKTSETSDESSTFANISNMVIHLRKAANHPLLFRFIYNDKLLREMAKAIKKEEKYWDANEQFIFEDMTVMTDLELNRLCNDHRSIKQYALKNEEWMDSGKVNRLKNLLSEMKEKKQKVLIFSQFTSMLDILELVMGTLQFTYLRMDGSTQVQERQNLIDQFNEQEDIDVFLLSTKAGGFGINLTGASIVILYDHDFNPQTDRQAEDRAHRVGQTKDVIVYKLVSENTIEKHILEMAEIKLRLDDSISSKEIHEDTRQNNTQSLLKRTLFASST
ncbi:P-loop containing nucleoside triphosphate hydrolase protein [Spinellus fusiger]|nr:P-loop containing nucleoside triphosphate hydrolase protein [Spinellus fusiger]